MAGMVGVLGRISDLCFQCVRFNSSNLLSIIKQFALICANYTQFEA